MEAAPQPGPAHPPRPGTGPLSLADPAGQVHVERSAASLPRVALPHASALAGAGDKSRCCPATCGHSKDIETNPTHPSTHTLLGNHFYNQPLRESRPCCPWAPAGQGEAGPGPAPPKHAYLLCVLVTLETGTLDSVATGFVSSHTEFWAAEPKAQRAQPCTWREPLGSCR